MALCRLLLKKPDILLLDEPTNHLDAESVAWLERHLQQYAGTVIAVTHDRYFLDNVAGWILELDRGRGIPWKGNYSSWLEQKQNRLQLEEKTESARQKTLQRELEWIRMAPKARQAKGKARLNAYEALLKQENEKRSEELEIYIPPGPAPRKHGHRSPKRGQRLRRPDLDGRSFLRPSSRGDRGRHRPERGRENHPLPPDHRPGKTGKGTIRIGETVKLAYVDQSRDTLNSGENDLGRDLRGPGRDPAGNPAR